jgi:hypothetical protein
MRTPLSVAVATVVLEERRRLYPETCSTHDERQLQMLTFRFAVSRRRISRRPRCYADTHLISGFLPMANKLIAHRIIRWTKRVGSGLVTRSSPLSAGVVSFPAVE